MFKLGDSVSFDKIHNGVQKTFTGTVIGTPIHDDYYLIGWKADDTSYSESWALKDTEISQGLDLIPSYDDYIAGLWQPKQNLTLLKEQVKQVEKQLVWTVTYDTGRLNTTKVFSSKDLAEKHVADFIYKCANDPNYRIIAHKVKTNLIELYNLNQAYAVYLLWSHTCKEESISINSTVVDDRNT